MSSYCDFAYVYDILMQDVDYKARTEYLLKLFKKYGKKPTLLLDLACGTGSLSVEFSKMGFEVIGTDASPDGRAHQIPCPSGSRRTGILEGGYQERQYWCMLLPDGLSLVPS